MLPGLRDSRGDLYKDLLIYWVLNGNDEEMKFIIRRMTGALRDQDESCINRLEEMLLHCTSQGKEDIIKTVVEKLYNIIISPEPKYDSTETVDRYFEKLERSRNQRKVASNILLKIGNIGLKDLRKLNRGNSSREVGDIIKQIKSSD